MVAWRSTAAQALFLWVWAARVSALTFEPQSGASYEAFLQKAAVDDADPHEHAAASTVEGGPTVAEKITLNGGYDKDRKQQLQAEHKKLQTEVQQLEAEEGLKAFYAEIDTRLANAAPLWKQLVVPLVAVCMGLPLMWMEGTLNTIGKVAIFFGAQTFMNLYMKVVLSGSVVSRELHLMGYPAGFAVTAMQQFTSFAIILLGIAVLWFSPWRYTPTIVNTKFGWMTVLAFSVTFTGNIALNNFSMSLLPLSVNLIIRSCSPLSTFFCEIATDKMAGRTVKDISVVEISLMLLGIACAGMAVIAKSQLSKASADPEAGSNVVLGVLVCLASLLSASMSMALAGLMGTSLKMNPIDTALYMAPPATLMLLVPIFFMPHPTEWPGAMLTDWQITKTVAQHAPEVIGLALLSGGFAVCYNVLTYSFVQSLSATHAAFASNFNKAATIALSVIIGLEIIQFNGWGGMMVAGVAGNIGAFTLYSLFKSGTFGGSKSLGKK